MHDRDHQSGSSQPRRVFLKSIAVASSLVPLVGAKALHASSAQKIRVGIIGCGSVSGVYLPHLKECPHVELVSTCDIKPERAKQRAEQFGIKHHYPHIDKMLTGEPFDLLVNTTDMQEHEHLNREAITAGKHVWSEKPIANSLQAGQQILTLAKEKGVRIWGAPAMVNSPQFAFMAKAVKDAKIGRPVAAHASYGHLGPTWSAFFYEEGGGSMPDLAVYNLTTLTGILGPVKSVTAMLSIVTPSRTVDDKGTIKVVVEDNASILLDHGNGCISHIQSGFNYFDPHGHDGSGQTWQRWKAKSFNAMQPMPKASFGKKGLPMWQPAWPRGKNL
jgi:predicted dehydrogenase